MRLLLDVNVGTRVADALSGAGHDVTRMALTDMTADDPAILSRAVTDDRVLVTCDRDFGELLFTRHCDQPPGIIYLRFRARDVERVITRLLPVLDMPQVKRHMTVIDDRRVRHTPFPDPFQRSDADD